MPRKWFFVSWVLVILIAFTGSTNILQGPPELSRTIFDCDADNDNDYDDECCELTPGDLPDACSAYPQCPDNPGCRPPSAGGDPGQGGDGGQGSGIQPGGNNAEPGSNNTPGCVLVAPGVCAAAPPEVDENDPETNEADVDENQVDPNVEGSNPAPVSALAQVTMAEIEIDTAAIAPGCLNNVELDSFPYHVQAAMAASCMGNTTLTIDDIVSRYEEARNVLDFSVDVYTTGQLNEDALSSCEFNFRNILPEYRMILASLNRLNSNLVTIITDPLQDQASQCDYIYKLVVENRLAEEFRNDFIDEVLPVICEPQADNLTLENIIIPEVERTISRYLDDVRAANNDPDSNACNLVRYIALLGVLDDGERRFIDLLRSEACEPVENITPAYSFLYYTHKTGKDVTSAVTRLEENPEQFCDALKANIDTLPASDDIPQACPLSVAEFIRHPGISGGAKDTLLANGLYYADDLVDLGAECEPEEHEENEEGANDLPPSLQPEPEDEPSIEVAYWAFERRNNDTSSIDAYVVIGADEFRIDDDSGDEYHPTVSPDGDRIIYLDEIDDTETYEIKIGFIRDRDAMEDGVQDVRTVDLPEGYTPGNFPMAWSPRRDVIAVTLLDGDGNPAIFRLSVEANNESALPFVENADSPAIDPAGLLWLFNYSGESGQGIAGIVEDGNQVEPRVISPPGATCFDPTFVGVFDVFFFCKDESEQIALFRAERSSNAERVHDDFYNGGEVQHPVYIPFETQLSMSIRQNGQNDYFLGELDFEALSSSSFSEVLIIDDTRRWASYALSIGY